MTYKYQRSSPTTVDIRSHHFAITVSDGICAAALLKNDQCELVIATEMSDDHDALQILLDHPELPKDLLKVSYTCLPQQSTLVPKALLINGADGSHLDLVHGNDGRKQAKSMLMDDPMAYCLFQADMAIEARILSQWPSAKAAPLQAQCIQSALSRRSNTPLLFLHQWDRRLDVVILNENGLLLSNSFDSRTPEDTLYFALFAAEQTHIREAEHKVMYAGPSIEKAHIELLERYCTRVEPALPNSTSGVQHPWKWLSLLERSLCVS